MDIKLDKNSATEALIKITLKESDYQTKVEEKVKEYSKKANIKGFRPGKVPAGMIRKLYGKAIKVEEINHLLSDSLRDYIKENDLKIIGEPLPNMDKTKDIDWDTQSDFEFEYNIGLVDDFEVNLSQKIKLYQIEVEDKGLKDAIENLKKQYGNIIEPEKSQEGDNLNGELTQEGADYKEEVWIITDSVIKKESKKFIGLKIGDSVDFDPKKLFKEKSEAANLLKKTEEEIKEFKGEFRFNVLKITRIESAEMNLDFFDKVFGKDVVKTEDEFKLKVKETLEQNYRGDAESYNGKLLRDKLLETTKFEIPESFYKQWLTTSSQTSIKEEDVEKDFDRYIEDLKWTLITQKIEQTNDLKVESEDVLNAAKDIIRSQFAAYGIPEELENQLDSYTQNYLSNNDGENYYRIYNTLKTQKVIETIRSKMDISYKKVKPEEFTKIITN